MLGNIAQKTHRNLFHDVNPMVLMHQFSAWRIAAAGVVTFRVPLLTTLPSARVNLIAVNL